MVFEQAFFRALSETLPDKLRPVLRPAVSDTGVPILGAEGGTGLTLPFTVVCFLLTVPTARFSFCLHAFCALNVYVHPLCCCCSLLCWHTALLLCWHTAFCALSTMPGLSFLSPVGSADVWVDYDLRYLFELMVDSRLLPTHLDKVAFTNSRYTGALSPKHIRLINFVIGQRPLQNELLPLLQVSLDVILCAHRF